MIIRSAFSQIYEASCYRSQRLQSRLPFGRNTQNSDDKLSQSSSPEPLSLEQQQTLNELQDIFTKHLAKRGQRYREQSRYTDLQTIPRLMKEVKKKQRLLTARRENKPKAKKRVFFKKSISDLEAVSYKALVSLIKDTKKEVIEYKREAKRDRKEGRFWLTASRRIQNLSQDCFQRLCFNLRTLLNWQLETEQAVADAQSYERKTDTNRRRLAGFLQMDPSPRSPLRESNLEKAFPKQDQVPVHSILP